MCTRNEKYCKSYVLGNDGRTHRCAPTEHRKNVYSNLYGFQRTRRGDPMWSPVISTPTKSLQINNLFYGRPHRASPTGLCYLLVNNNLSNQLPIAGYDLNWLNIPEPKPTAGGFTQKSNFRGFTDRYPSLCVAQVAPSEKIRLYLALSVTSQRRSTTELTPL